MMSYSCWLIHDVIYDVISYFDLYIGRYLVGIHPQSWAGLIPLLASSELSHNLDIDLVGCWHLREVRVQWTCLFGIGISVWVFWLVGWHLGWLLANLGCCVIGRIPCIEFGFFLHCWSCTGLNHWLLFELVLAFNFFLHHVPPCG